jgi:prepilin-type N-terminal cleavage/methylation domain-containing protein
MNRQLHQVKRGFTLIEVLLAMVVSMMILAGIGFLYYSIAMAWISHKEGDTVLQHNHSILAFLEDELSVKSRLPTVGEEDLDEQLQWARLPEAGIYDPVYLSWVSATPPPFIESTDWYDGLAVRFYLKYDVREGLFLIWHPDDPKISRMSIPNYGVKDYIFEFPLSTKVVGFSYAYYDATDDKWEEIENSRNFDPKERGIPDAIVLEIEDRERFTRTIYLYQKEQNDG